MSNGACLMGCDNPANFGIFGEGCLSCVQGTPTTVASCSACKCIDKLIFYSTKNYSNLFYLNFSIHFLKRDTTSRWEPQNALNVLLVEQSQLPKVVKHVMILVHAPNVKLVFIMNFQHQVPLPLQLFVKDVRILIAKFVILKLRERYARHVLKDIIYLTHPVKMSLIKI
jgi:hypothetical protein